MGIQQNLTQHNPNTPLNTMTENQNQSPEKLRAVKTLALTLGMVFVCALGVFIYMLADRNTQRAETMQQVADTITEHALKIPQGATVTKITTQDRKIITHYTLPDGRMGVDMYDTYTGKTQRGIVANTSN